MDPREQLVSDVLALARRMLSGTVFPQELQAELHSLTKRAETLPDGAVILRKVLVDPPAAVELEFHRLRVALIAKNLKVL